MQLAAMSFSDPLMLAGLLAALVPVVLHLLNRVKAPVVLFPTLRFLRITAQRTARRRQIQQYFLLLVRVVVFALLAMAVAAPLIRGGSAGLAYGLVGMLLLALGLMVLGGVWGAAALDEAKRGAGQEAITAAGTAAGRGKRYGALAGVALVLAMMMAGAGVYGLASDRFFTGDRGTFTGRSTAVAIILDNSHSMLAREESATRLQRGKQLVRQLLGDAPPPAPSLRPAEATLLPTNPGDLASTMPLTADTTRLLGALDTLTAGGGTRGRALPMQERIRTALQLLEGSRQASKMLVIVSDFVQPAFADAGVFAGTRESPLKGDLQVVLMPIGASPPPADVGITSFGLAAGSERPVAGAQVTFEATFLNNGDAADVRDFAFTVDGVAAEGSGGEGRVQLGAAGTASGRTLVRLPYRLKEAGVHRFGLQLENAPDGLAWNDKRELVLEVAQQVKVLVLGAEGGERPRPRSAAFYFQAALAPFTGRGGGGGQPWSIEPTYRGMNEVDLAGVTPGAYGAVFACDLPTVPAALAEALLRYTREGGKVVWVLGPGIDGRQYNEVVVARDLLPAALEEPVVTPTAMAVEWVDLQSGLFMNLFESQEPFRALLVNGRWRLATEGEGGGEARGRPLMKLAEGVPLVQEHVPAGAGRSGEGKVYTLLTTPAATWSNLGATVLLVPVASRMALGDAAESRSATSYEPGETVQLRLPNYESATTLGALTGPTGAPLSVDVTTPENATINAQAQLIGERGQSPRWTFDRTLVEGVYRWRSTDARFQGMFVVNPPGEEADLQGADLSALAREASPGAGPGKEAIVAATAGDLLGALEQRGEGTSLFPGLIAMVLMLAVVESLLANRGKGEGEIRAGAAEGARGAVGERALV